MVSATGTLNELARFCTGTNVIPLVKQRQLLKVCRPLKPQPLDDEENNRYGEQTEKRAVENSLRAERHVAAKTLREHATGNRQGHRRNQIADHARDFRHDYT